MQLIKKDDFEHLFLNDLTPAQPKARYEYIQSLERSGLPFLVMLLTYSSGNNTRNPHFIWKVPVENTAEECQSLLLMNVYARYY